MIISLFDYVYFLIAEPDRALDDDTIKGIRGFGYQNLLRDQDEQEKLMARSRMAVLYCTIHRRTELNLKVYLLKITAAPTFHIAILNDQLLLSLETQFPWDS